MKKLISILLSAAMLLALCACGAVKPEDIVIEYDGDEVKTLEFTVGDDDDEDIILEAKLEPAGAEGEIEWESSDKSVVKVKDNGDGSCKIVLKDVGDARVSAVCGDLKAKVKIYVNEAPAAEESAEEAIEEAVEEPAPAVESVSAAEDIYGGINGTHFEVPAPGIAMDLPTGWVFLSDAEVQSMYGMAVGMMQEGEIKDALAAGNSAFLMVAQNSIGDSVNINISELTGAAAYFTEESMASLTLPILEQEMEGAGFTVKNIETFTGYEFAGKEHCGITLTIETQGITLYERLIFVIQDSYYYCLTATSLTEGCEDEILAMFYGI